MGRPSLEVADIFRGHGAAWREANRGHVSLGQLKVMSAIENCRTAALGGHVAACENSACGHTAISYNSCMNRHCPKCQGAAAREWLAAREAELLPVQYFHQVFTLPAPIADIAYQNKAAIYDMLFKASAETMLKIAADPKHLGAKIGFIAVLHTWGSAMTHHPHVHMIVPGGGLSPDGSRWIACRRGFLLPVLVLSKLFRRLMLEKLAAAHKAGKLRFFGEHAHLAGADAFAAFLAPLKKTKWFVYSKRPFSGPETVLAYLSRYTHRVAISNRRLIAADKNERHLHIQGLPHRGARPLQDHDARYGRVHPPLPDACAAQGLPPHPPLWAAGQRHPRGEPRHHAHLACHGGASVQRQRCGQSRCARLGYAGRHLPLLRRPHAHRRDLRGKMQAAETGLGSGQDRHVMSRDPKRSHSDCCLPSPPLSGRPRRRLPDAAQRRRFKLQPASLCWRCHPRGTLTAHRRFAPHSFPGSFRATRMPMAASKSS